jgi:phosphonate degradation associated HDIG domain protein
MRAASLDDIACLLERRGSAQYGREAISQYEHALQCAELALRGGSDAALISAALLHDIGHLSDTEAETADEEGRDVRHEATGARWLSDLFGEDVLTPIRLHVAAKRYLTAVEESYMATLSPQSVRSLELQGGPFSPVEAERFVAAPHARDAILLRRWDDQAKMKDRITPGLDHFMPYLQESVRS